MKRRTFIKAMLGALALPFLPKQAEALPVPAKPLTPRKICNHALGMLTPKCEGEEVVYDALTLSEEQAQTTKALFGDDKRMQARYALLLKGAH